MSLDCVTGMSREAHGNRQGTGSPVRLDQLLWEDAGEGVRIMGREEWAGRPPQRVRSPIGGTTSRSRSRQRREQGARRTTRSRSWGRDAIRADRRWRSRSPLRTPHKQTGSPRRLEPRSPPRLVRSPGRFEVHSPPRSPRSLGLRPVELERERDGTLTRAAEEEVRRIARSREPIAIQEGAGGPVTRYASRGPDGENRWPQRYMKRDDWRSILVLFSRIILSLGCELNSDSSVRPHKGTERERGKEGHAGVITSAWKQEERQKQQNEVC